MKKILKKYITIMMLSPLFLACDKDDLTGESTLVKSNPTISINIPNNAATFIEKDSTFQYVISIDQPQIADIAIYLTQIAGDATEGEDFTIGTPVVIIPANRTSAVASISVKADNIPEGTETFTIQFGDDRTANAVLTAQTVQFTINNYSEGDLALHFSWETEFYDVTGEAVAATDVANMILFITDEDGNVIETVNGASFEDVVLGAEFPDGNYLLKTGIASRIHPGDLGVPPMLDLLLEYSQNGVIAPTTLRFVGAFDTQLVCQGNLFTLASLSKTGTTFNIERIGEVALPSPPSEGDYIGVDSNIDGEEFKGTADVNIELDGEVYKISGLNTDFMETFWGEAIQTSVPVTFTVDEEGNITIEDQYIFTTLYDGDLYEYHISGTGKVSVCGDITIDYELSQDGFLVGEWLHDNGYMTDSMFKATLSPGN